MDSICLKAGIMGITPQITVAGDLRSNPSHISAAIGRSSTSAVSSISAEKPSISGAAPQHKSTAPWGFPFRYPLKTLWPGGRSRYDAVAVDDAVSIEENEEKQECVTSERNENWVLKILHVRSLWKEEGGNAVEELVDAGNQLKIDSDERNEFSGDDEECDVCKVDVDDEKDEKIEFDKFTFSKLLRRVSLPEARLYSKLSYLGSLAYSIPEIKPGNLLKKHGLRFVTSSPEKKAQLESKAEKEKALEEVEKAVEQPAEAEAKEKSDGNQISANIAYKIVSSGASYLQSRTMSILPFKSSNSGMNGGACEGVKNGNMMNAEVASLMATTDSVTAVVAAKEEVKQAVADELNSIRSSPCEWFICDDDQSSTRFFVIQGSESLASWQANLLFEPIEFEGLDVIVHRGIYEAAKGAYEQMLPEVQAHLEHYGGRARFRFTGHSLGGSLSLLVNLMLLIRDKVPRSSLLPVITFGAPSIMCGGDRLFRKLGLPRSHLQAITMHRDIVPRAFSCNYPNRVAELLKAINGNFRNHPCLNNQRLLYAPMGEFLILQPDEKMSPNHHLLPSGSGLYILTSPVVNASEAEAQLRAAQSAFLNSPHPLEILSDRSAYGSEGTIRRDHHMDSYLKSVRSVIRQELNHMRKTRREKRRRVWWPLVAAHSTKSGGGVVVENPVGPGNMAGQGQGRLNFGGVLRNGRESLRRFTRLVASQHMHLLVVVLLPARLLIGFVDQ